MDELTMNELYGSTYAEDLMKVFTIEQTKPFVDCMKQTDECKIFLEKGISLEKLVLFNAKVHREHFMETSEIDWDSLSISQFLNS